MTNSKKPKGWVKEPVRHGLAAKGIKTRRKNGRNGELRRLEREKKQLEKLYFKSRTPPPITSFAEEIRKLDEKIAKKRRELGLSYVEEHFHRPFKVPERHTLAARGIKTGRMR
jgi:hypothetical protein